MYQPVILYIGLRYVFGRGSDHFGRFIFCLSTIGIMIGVMALVTVLSVMNGFEKELEENILNLIPQAFITNHEKKINPERVPASILNYLKGVTYISPFITSDVILQSTYSISMGNMIGVNPIDPEPLFHYLVQEQLDDLSIGKYRVILGNKLAAQLNVKCGDSLRLIIPNISQLTPIGHIPSQRIFTVINTFIANSEVDNYQLLINQRDASRLMHYPDGYITGWRIWLKQPLSVNYITSQSLPRGLIWHDWRERKGELFQAVRMEKNMMGLLLSLIIIVAMFNIVTSLSLLVMEKQIEVAILKTQGISRAQVMTIFIVQGASAGIFGTLLGTIFGVLLVNQLNILMSIINKLSSNIQLPVAINPLQVVAIVLSVIIITLLSTIYPSWRAATIHPVEALRHE